MRVNFTNEPADCNPLGWLSPGSPSGRLDFHMARLIRILRESSTEPVELLSALIALLLGVRILDPTTEAFTSSSAYALLEAMAPELAWGIIITTFGVAKILVICYGSRGLASIFAAIMGSFWAFLALLFLLSPSPSTIAALFAILALSCWWARWRR